MAEISIWRKLIHEFREDLTRQEDDFFEKKIRAILAKYRKKQQRLCFGLDKFLHSSE